MDTASYVALSRQVNLFRRMDAIANNVANANTTGFKSDVTLFREYLIPAGNAGNVAFSYDQGTIQNFEQGPLQPTGRPLDVAINGKGFFEIDTPAGPRYTRAGNFKLSLDGLLVTQDGYPVGSGGAITINPDDTDITVKGNGVVTAKVNGREEIRGQLTVVMFENLAALKKSAGGMFTSSESPIDATPGTDYTVAQGMVEMSNVNATQQLSEMIKVNRSVGSVTKLMGNLNDMQRDAIAKISQQE